jgi:hypothetical protein
MIHLSCLLFHALLWSPALVHARAVSCAASTWLGSHSTTASGADCYAVDSLSSPARNVTTPPSSAETVNFNKASRSHRVIQEELDTIGRRRVAAIISSVTQTSSITKWCVFRNTGPCCSDSHAGGPLSNQTAVGPSLKSTTRADVRREGRTGLRRATGNELVRGHRRPCFLHCGCLVVATTTLDSHDGSRMAWRASWC